MSALSVFCLGSSLLWQCIQGYSLVSLLSGSVLRVLCEAFESLGLEFCSGWQIWGYLLSSMHNRLTVFCFTASINFWVCIYHVHLSGSWFPHSGLIFLVPSICMQISRCHYFLPLVVIPLCTTFSSLFCWGASELFPGFCYYKYSTLNIVEQMSL